MFDGKKVIIFDIDGTILDTIGMWTDVDVNLIYNISGVNKSKDNVRLEREQFLAKNTGIEVINIYNKYSDNEREQIIQLSDYCVKDFEELINTITKGDKEYRI